MPFPDFEPTLPSFLRLITSRFPEREMVVLGEARLTYRDAEERSGHLAQGLIAEGVGKGTRVGVLMPNGPDWLLAFLAVTRLGAIAVPLNTFLKPPELAWAVRHADIHTLLTIGSFLGNEYPVRLEDAAPELQRATSHCLYLPTLPNLRQVFCWGAPDRPWARPGHTLEESGRTGCGT